MENIKSSVFSRLMSILFIVMGVFLGIYAFFANATTWTLPLGSGWNNMTSYIDSTFWNNNPTDDDIITALYGTGDQGSIYTKNRSGYNSGACLSGGMTVVYTGQLSLTTLASHTIYVLTGPISTGSATINMQQCSVIISNYTSGTTFYSTNQLANSMFYASNRNYIIFENIGINGTGGGPVPDHTNNNYGIILTNNNSVTIHKTNIYNNLQGLFLGNGSRYTVEDSAIYNNTYDGIYTDLVDHLFVNNVQVYNNDGDGGIFAEGGCDYCSLNNMQIYNNTIGIQGGLNNSLFNNINIYNTQYDGISIGSSTDISFHNISLYNNRYGISIITSTGITFYGTLKTFNNQLNITGGSLITGNGGDYPEFGRGAGNRITTGSMTRESMTNPANTNSSYLNTWTGISSSVKGYKTMYTNTTTTKYSYGGNITTQIMPVYYRTTSLGTGAIFDTTHYIGSSTKYFSGNVYTNTYTNTSGTTINLSSTGTVNYRIFGDTIETTGSFTTSTSKNVTLSDTDGMKNIFVQFRNGSDRATHYATTTVLDTIDPSITGANDGYYYNTDVFLTGSDNVGFSGVEISGTMYTGVSTTLSLEDTYTITGYDYAGNTTTIGFTIDKTNPIFTGADNGYYYHTGILLTGEDDIGFSGFELNGTRYPGISLFITGENKRIITGYDLAGNTATISFTIDKTNPIFTGTTLGSSISGNVINNGYYNTGIRITFYDPNISGATLNGALYNSGDLISLQSGYTFLVNDLVGNSTGIIFTIDTTNPLVTGNYPTTGLNITGTNDVTFLRSGSDNIVISGYTLYVTGAEIHTYTTTNTGYTITGLDNGIYTRYIVATDIAGNTGASAMSTFRISTPLNATATLTGGTMIQIGSTRYTKLDATFALRANQPCRYTITGTYLASFSGDYIGDMTLSRSLTGSDGDKVIYITFSTGTETPVTITNTVKLDTTTYAPTLLSPLTGTSVGGTAELRRNHSSIPEAVGRSGYRYYLSYTGTFSSLIASGTVADTITGVNISSGFTSTGTVYRYVEAIDKLGNTSGSAISSFIYDTTADIIPNSFSFNDVTDARLDRVYVSNTLTITGMTTGVNVLASINRGALYISGNFVGTTGYIQNGRTVKIELTSSDEYDEIISSTLTINGISDTFSVTTMEEDEDNGTDYEDIDTNLSNTEKLMIIAVFETLRDLYAGDKEEEFFNTFMLMLEEKMDDFDDNDDEYDALKYLYDLVEQYYEDGDFGDNVSTTPWIVNNIYTAPNGKKYTITYDSSKQRFTSTNFVVPKYFPTLDTLKYIIDINNPVGSKYANAKPILARWKRAAIDGTRQASPYTAPNKKAFYFFKTIDERYSSYTFTSERYFNSLLDVKEFINSTNKK